MQLKGKAIASNARVPKFWKTAKIRAFIGCDWVIIFKKLADSNMKINRCVYIDKHSYCLFY
jgi:hypothetical protein